jgi:uncharacterized protein (TIGR00369 family)
MGEERVDLSWGEDCFVCGAENPEGLRLHFAVDEKARTIETVWVPKETHQGYTGVVHGGLVATVLDEALGKLSVSLGMAAVTAELSVRFLRPVPTQRPLRVRGSIGENGRRLLTGEAEALLEDGTVAARAQARLVRGKT